MSSYTLLTGRGGYSLVRIVVWGEITNPIINLAEVLEYRGAKEKYITPLKMLFLVTFIPLRIIEGRATVYDIQRSNSDFLFKLPPTFVCFQSFEWIWMMLNKLGKLAHEVSLILNISL